MQLAGALAHSSEYRLVGFVDEEKGFLHTQILGLDVYPANSISALINKLKIEGGIACYTVCFSRQTI